MLNDAIKQQNIKEAAKRALAEAEIRKKNMQERILPPEINGCKGKKPTRFDDWEPKGIAYHF